MANSANLKELGHIGWLGIGNMGYAMARRLAEAGANLTVFNRSVEKAQPLAAHGARVARDLSEVGDCDIIATMLSTGDVVEEMLFGSAGLLAKAAGRKPKLVIDCSSISVETSGAIRERLNGLGIAFFVSPVSGNPEVVESGNGTFVCSGSAEVFERVKPLLTSIGKAASYVGEGELARVAKICHNVWLGSISQALAEVMVLAQKAGLTRGAFLAFLNNSALGSAFTKGRTESWVEMNRVAGFSPSLMRKDMDLGLDLARSLEMSMSLSNLTRDILQALINSGEVQPDYTQGLLLQQAKISGVQMSPESK
jgi:3-hydroxyisobutyrate dehydrogenase